MEATIDMGQETFLDCLRRVQAIAQNGLAYSRDPFDLERFEELQKLAAEGLSSLCAGDAPDWMAVLTPEKGYATPKVTVRGGVFRDDQILLVRERSDVKWTLPGGWVDVNESPSEAITKEVREESGYEALARKLVAVHDRRKHAHPPMFFHVYKLFFLCELIGGTATESIETDGVGFFPESGLPELSTPRVNADQIRMLFRHQRTPELATEFD
jgi:ADP-ribose pyrophosphatase YjhB (NUDIX family)